MFVTLSTQESYDTLETELGRADGLCRGLSEEMADIQKRCEEEATAAASERDLELAQRDARLAELTEQAEVATRHWQAEVGPSRRAGSSHGKGAHNTPATLVILCYVTLHYIILY